MLLQKSNTPYIPIQKKKKKNTPCMRDTNQKDWPGANRNKQNKFQ